jgi:mono/diheme cytochrome c family protein
MRRAVILTLAFCFVDGLACNRSDVATGSLAFLIESEPVTSLTVEGLTRRIPARRVDVFEPYERDEVAFNAIPLDQVLDAAYGPSWREHEAILFTCRDGYQPMIPVRRVVEQRGYLAVARPGNVGFTILKYEEGTKKRIDLGPFYVIWENLDDARMRSEGDYGWPYQIVQIDLVTFRSHFRDMAPPEGASPEVSAGFEAFVVHCSKCHTINGHGGDIGPELNYPANPTEYMNDAWLRKWIDDPTSMRLAPRMPPLNPELPERARIVEEIVVYLETMALHKVEPPKR